MKTSLREPWVVVVVAAVAVFAGVGAIVITSSPSSPGSRSTSAPSSSGPNVTVGSYPSSVTYDPINGLLYVTNLDSDNVSVVNATTLHVVATVPTGSAARWGALDPVNGKLYVANDYAGSLSVIDTANDSLVTTFDTTGYEFSVGVQYDSGSGLLYVLENLNDVLLGLNPAGLTTAAVIPVLPNPGGEQYAIDDSSNTIYFPARGSYEVQVIDDLNGTTVAGLPTPPGPYGPTTTFLDPTNGLLYVMLGGLLDNPGHQIAIMNPATGAVVSTVTVGAWPNTYAYDAARDLLYVACEASNNLAVIDTLSNQLVGMVPLANGSLPGAVAVDPTTGNVFVTELGTGMMVELGPGGTSLSAAIPVTEASHPARLD